MIPKRRMLWRAIVPGAIAAVVAVGAIVVWLPRPTPPLPPPPAPKIAPVRPVNPVVPTLTPAAPSHFAAIPAGIPPASANLFVAIGDPLSKVQTSYGIKAEPVPDGARQTMLRAPIDGLMFFFNAQDKILGEIRADAPFGGAIDGVRIGDSLDDVIGKLGQPTAPPWNFGKNRAYLFSVGGHKLRCDFDPAGKVATIFILG